MGVKTIKVYRNGGLTPAEYDGEILSYAVEADSRRPAHVRAHRVGSLYASPSLPGVIRWTRANLMSAVHADPQTYEITVPGTTMIFPVEDWEAFSWHGEPVERYWARGMTLAEYAGRGHDDRNWEVLLSPEDVLSYRRVSAKRLLSVVSDDYDTRELAGLLKRHRVR